MVRLIDFDKKRSAVSAASEDAQIHPSHLFHLYVVTDNLILYRDNFGP